MLTVGGGGEPAWNLQRRTSRPSSICNQISQPTTVAFHRLAPLPPLLFTWNSWCCLERGTEMKRVGLFRNKFDDGRKEKRQQRRKKDKALTTQMPVSC